MSEATPVRPRFEESFISMNVSPFSMDALWAQGWRHQGGLFFRYTHCVMLGMEHEIVPVRIDLRRFELSKSQRRVWRKNADLRWVVEPAVVDESMRAIFAAHSSRFVENVPASLEDFLGDQPSSIPCRCHAVKAYLGEQLIACSFVDAGAHSVSSVYAIFDPAFSKRGLGTLTLLKEIEIAQFNHKHFLYHGFATPKPSLYDYKKNFTAIQCLDWHTGNWLCREETTLIG